MDRIELHDAFVAQGSNDAPQPAVSLGAGVVWGNAYAAVGKAGRYVQGGGCLTVGVAGLIQSGGFGSFSKRYGMAAASLLEAEVVTADGAVRIANAHSNPELFWGLKGGGGGSLGVITRVTLKTHDLPPLFGAAFGAVKATSDAAFKRLIERFMTFYRDSLFNPTWGETVSFRPDNVLEVSMVFQDLDQPRAAAVWQPFFDWIREQGGDYAVVQPPSLHPCARRLRCGMRLSSSRMRRRWCCPTNGPAPRPPTSSGAPTSHEAGWFLHAYQSTWLPAALLADDRRGSLTDALFDSTRRRRMTLHFNKGLAGAPAEAIAAARDTATNPVVTEAFALAISAAEGPPAFAGVAGHEPDLGARPPRCRERGRCHGRATEGRAEPRRLRLGVELLRGRLAEGVLGHELRAAARGEGQIRSGRPVLRPSRRRQRGLEPRRLHAAGVTLALRWPILGSVPSSRRRILAW